MEALSSEWMRDSVYNPGDRVAFKLSDSLGVAAFECLVAPRMLTNPSQEAIITGNTTQEGSQENYNTTTLQFQFRTYPTSSFPRKL
ncbi:hypothetical protein BJ165DRAFT_1523035 [Panaeolus papilionaceus]|nr:hypothetical protein BJ165DRAFT_1523035 [Panaeolus papilionaceus]